MKRILLIGLAGLGLISCDPKSQYKEELTKIDSLQVTVTKLEERYDNIQFDSLKLMVEHVESNEDSIHLYYQPDTLNEEFGRWMTECKTIRKRLSGLDKKKMDYGDEINAIKHQLINLHDDVEAGLYSKDEIQGYIKKEEGDLKKVYDSFMEFYEVQKAEKRIYYVTVPKVDIFIAGLERK